MGRRFYNTSRTSTPRDLYGTSIRTEISMRDELIKTLDGSFPEIAKKQQGVLRVMNRDDNGDMISCACTNSTTHEGDKDHYCPLCLGEGFYWTEQYVYFYRFEPGIDASLALKEQNMPPGNFNVPLKVFYIDYQETLTIQDRVIELMLDSSGQPTEPLRRRAIYRLGTLYDYRLDNGRLEYWKAIGYEHTLLPLITR